MFGILTDIHNYNKINSVIPKMTALFDRILNATNQLFSIFNCSLETTARTSLKRSIRIFVASEEEVQYVRTKTC